MKKYIVEICIGTPCHLMGAQDLINAVQDLPGGVLERIQLRSGTCLHLCDRAPAVRINGEIYAPITPAELVQMLSK